MNIQQRLTENCPICGTHGSELLLTKYGYSIVRCRGCHIQRVEPIPSDDALREHYQNPAYFEGDEAQGYQDYGAMKKALRPHFQRRLEIIGRHRPEKGKLLDFGCAAGYFLEMAQARGWQISGIELSEEMAQQAAHSLNIPIASQLEEIEDQFDLITLWEVIEHLPSPVDSLHSLREKLYPKGMLMLSTPNTGHWQAIQEPEQWIGYRPPSHLYFFTAQTLADTLTRAGFEKISITRVSPLPPLPSWVRSLTAPLQRRLTTGQAKSWQIELYLWRAIRLLGWGWQKIAHRQDDIFTTLEAVAFRP